MIVMLIVVGILSAAVIAMLLSVPSILKSNEANIKGNNNNNKTNGSSNIQVNRSSSVLPAAYHDPTVNW
jgi:competence protein ComGC